MAHSTTKAAGFFIYDTTSNTGKPYVSRYGETYRLDTLEDATPFDSEKQAHEWLEKNYPSQQWATVIPNPLED